MAKASDNVFPSLLLAEGAAPSTPSAGQHRLFVDTADDKLKRKDAAGTVVTVEGGSASVPTVSAARTAGDITISYSASLTIVHSDLDLTIAAAVGDVIELNIAGAMSGRSSNVNQMNVNITAKTRVSGADVNNVAPGGATFVPAWFVCDDPSTVNGGIHKVVGSHLYTVQSGDLSGGNVTFRFYYQSANSGGPTRTLYAATGTLPLGAYAKNLKH